MAFPKAASLTLRFDTRPFDITSTESALALLATVCRFKVPFTVTLSRKVLLPPNVWAPAVTIPGLVASAGCRMILREVLSVTMVAPFISAEAATAPMVMV